MDTKLEKRAYFRDNDPLPAAKPLFI